MAIRLCSVIFMSIILFASSHHPLGGSNKGFSLGIRDSIMIAHSFEGEGFGPAQEMHGATYTVDAEFRTQDLVPKYNWVMDIGMASEMLGDVLREYNFKNLNELFPGENTTTEFMSKVIFDELAARCKNDFTGSICVKLWESHKAWACYEGDVGGHEDLECLGDAESHNDT